MAGNSHRAGTIGAAAVAAAARKYDLVTESTAAWDLTNPRNGYKYEVKSCRTERSGGSPGRLRLWETEHHELASHRGAYIFVVYNGESGQIWRIEKVPTGRVTEAVGGRWYNSGHAQKGRQYKLPWRAVL